MEAVKNIDLALIAQSIPSLVLSLIGLSLSGKKLDTEQKMDYATIFPIILLSNCILSFKGNTELIYAMYLSSLSQVKDRDIYKYLRYAFDNACVVLSQSIVIGVSVGLLGVARNIAGKIRYEYLFFRMISMCLIASFTSSLIIIAILVPAVIMATSLGANPDNIVLPVIASIGDYVDIFILIYCIKKYQYSTLPVCIISILMVFSFLPILIYVSVRSKQRIPIQSATILFITYILSTVSGYIIQYYSKQHLDLAASYPIFVGLTGACSYIYLNRKITSIQNLTSFNRKKGFFSVLITSIIISAVIILFMPLLGIHFKKAFNYMFIMGFFITVAVLLKLIDFLLVYFIKDMSMAGVIGLPLITSIADFIGCLVVLSICFMVYQY